MFLVACTTPGREGPVDPTLAGQGAPEPVADADLDGLCDATETGLGTNPFRQDTDGDGFPDLIETAFGFGPTDRSVPDVSETVFLSAEAGAEAEFTVRLTVDGDGQAYAGAFQPMPALYDVDHTAADFFQGGWAQGADPIDNTRGFGGGTERFESIFGPTRLRFALRFANKSTGGAPLDCVVAHPFGYLIKDETGAVVSQHRYLLVLVPPGAQGLAEDYCQPAACF